MTQYPDLTPEQSAALEAFAEANTRPGKNWRDTLCEGWMRAAYPGPLQQVRNRYGGLWLTTVYAYGWRASLPEWARPTFDASGAVTSHPLPGNVRWSALAFDPPAIGARVDCGARLKCGAVTGYFVQDGWLGLIVRLDTALESGSILVHVFGAECRPV
jgi:hypothetical protein